MDEIAVPTMRPPMISSIAATTNTHLRVRSGWPKRISIDAAALGLPGAAPVPAEAEAEASAGGRHVMKGSLMCGYAHNVGYAVTYGPATPVVQASRKRPRAPRPPGGPAGETQRRCRGAVLGARAAEGHTEKMREPPEPAPGPAPAARLARSEEPARPGAPARPEAPAQAKTPAWAEEAVAQFHRHVAAERGLSPHTVRGYVGDVQSLLEHAAQSSGATDVTGLTPAVLRSWLADQHRAGASRATLARRGAAARAFTAFAHQRGWLATDPGAVLGTPKVRRTLPHVLRHQEISDVLASSAADVAQPPPDRTPAEAAVALRDGAILELLYATGIRGSELCGLDTDALDLGPRTGRGFGRGAKERTAPLGIPAVRAVEQWQQAGRPVLVTGASAA